MGTMAAVVPAQHSEPTVVDAPPRCPKNALATGPCMAPKLPEPVT